MMKNSIYPCFWFDNNAKLAANFYCSIFPDARIIDENPIVVRWEWNNQKFMCLNGGPKFQFNESISFVIECDTQEEIDYFWNAITTNGGAESMCGWCRDKFGVSWQVVPSVLGKLMSQPEKSERVMQAFLKMKKFDIQTLLNV